MSRAGKRVNGSKTDEAQNRRDLAETKRLLAAGGQKPFPSHLGTKTRHQDGKRKSMSKKVGNIIYVIPVKYCYFKLF